MERGRGEEGNGMDPPPLSQILESAPSTGQSCDCKHHRKNAEVGRTFLIWLVRHNFYRNSQASIASPRSVTGSNCGAI